MSFKRFSGLASRGCLAVLLAGIPQLALPQVLSGPAYMESYAGEEAFPLRPEIDRFRLGGMTGFSGSLDPLPVIVEDGVVAQATTAGVNWGDQAFSGTASGFAAIGETLQPFSVRARFDEFLSDSPFSLKLAATAVTAPGYQISALVINVPAFPGFFDTVGVYELDASGVLVSHIVPWTAPPGRFELELVVDPLTAVVQARAIAEGNIVETAQIELTAYRPVDDLAQYVGNVSALTPAATTTWAKFQGICVSGARGAKACPVLLDHLNPAR